MSASPGFQPHLMMAIQLYQTSSSAVVVQALQIMLSKHGKVVIRKINASGFDIMKKRRAKWNIQGTGGCTLVETPKSTSHWVL